jgi:hypothetical protein
MVAFAVCFTSPKAQAVSLSLEPSAQTVVLGNLVDVAVRIADLDIPALSTFDLDISFDPGILTFSQATFGDPVLGDQLDILGLGSLTDAIPGVGVVNLFELSFDLPEDLTALQAPSFTLATLTFSTTAQTETISRRTTGGVCKRFRSATHGSGHMVMVDRRLAVFVE